MHTTYPDSEDTPVQQLPLQRKIYSYPHKTALSRLFTSKTFDRNQNLNIIWLEILKYSTAIVVKTNYFSSKLTNFQLSVTYCIIIISRDLPRRILLKNLRRLSVQKHEEFSTRVVISNEANMCFGLQNL